uniref:START domain-containing protein n=1 Tax=Lotharella globosa TaxID=91324 RepID=A0A7S3Z8G9_9EUKA|mmetsp:Transcript_17121/g.32567  ORF Transcript_17121/g.32567 Transcript_17121/m.32567 type:complete len:275 (+) Transcript_17121:86-910(+)
MEDQDDKKEEVVVHQKFLETALQQKDKVKDCLSRNSQALYAHIEDCKKSEKWQLVLNKGGVEVYAPKQKENTFCEFLTVTIHPLSPLEVFSFLRDNRFRTEWDKNVSKHMRVADISISQDTDLGCDLTYTRTKPIAGGLITARSYLNMRKAYYDESTGTFIESAVSVDEIFSEIPERLDDSIAARLHLGSGGLFEPYNGGSHCKMSYLTMTDPKGWIPHSIANKVMPQELVSYMGLMREVMTSEKFPYKVLNLDKNCSTGSKTIAAAEKKNKAK